MFSTGGEWRWTSQKATCLSDSTYGRDRVPTRRLSMRKLNEVLRLRFELGLGQRAIARACSISQGAVHNYLRKRQQQGSVGRCRKAGTKNASKKRFSVIDARSNGVREPFQTFPASGNSSNDIPI